MAKAMADKHQLLLRLSAPKRSGCPYRLAAFSTAPCVDASSWLAGDIMARLFGLGRSL